MFRLLKLVRLEPGTPVTAEGTILEFMPMEEIEFCGENIACDDKGLTFMELKNGKVLVDNEADVIPLVAQLLYV